MHSVQHKHILIVLFCLCKSYFINFDRLYVTFVHLLCGYSEWHTQKNGMTQNQSTVILLNENTQYNKQVVPGDTVSQTCLEQQVSVWQQVVTNEVLIGPHRHTMAHTQRAKYLQHLEHNLSALHPATAP